MAWVWTAVGICGVFVGALTLSAAGAVYMASPRRLQNRLLAAFLALNAATIAAGYGFMYLTDARADAYAWQVVACVLGGAPYLCLYPAFLSTLPTPLAPLLSKARPALYLTAMALPVVVLAAPERFVAGMVPGTVAPWDAVIGRWWATALYAFVAVSLLGVALAANLYMRSRPHTLQRAQATAYFAAFATLDLAYGVTNGMAPWYGWPVWSYWVSMSGSALFVLLLTYGMLKTQLFDLDIRVKWTLRRGTVVAAFGGVFLVVAQVASEFLTGALGWLAGGLAAGAMFLALRPIERAAGQLADRAMPHVHDTAEYRTVRKRELYLAAVQSAMEDGVLSDKERNVLATLADKLGLGAKEALDLEREARSARTDAASPSGR